MKFIYSLMLITFLTTTFAFGKAYIGVDKCQRQLETCLNMQVEADKSACVISSGGAYQKCLSQEGLTNNTQAYHPDNKSFQTCKAKPNAQINSTDFSKCVFDLEAKNKTPAPPKPSAPPKSTAQSAIACDSKEGQAFAAGGKCGCRSEYEVKTQNPLTCVKKVVAPPVVGQCDGKTTLKDCTCVAPETPIMVSGGAQNSSSNIFGCKPSTLPAPIEPPGPGADCLATARHYSSQCERDASSAVNKCDTNAAERETDSPDVGQILKQIGNAAVAKGSGSGAYDACLKTALISQSGYFAIDEFKSANCDPSVNQCKSSCEAAENYISQNSDVILNQCMTEFSKLNESVTVTQEQSNDYRDSVIEVLAEIGEETKSAKNDCDVDAVSLQDKLKQTANDFNNAAKQAQVCRCQTGSTGEDCNAIKGPAQCVLNPNAPGCALSTVNCNNSNSIQCRCLKNPNLAECKTGGGGRESGLVGKPFSTPSSSIGSGAAPKINNGDLDISFADEALNAGASGTEGSATSPFGSAQASGGGGGGAGGGGAGTGEEDPTKTADGEGGLKPLLDKPKGFIAGVLNKLGFGPNPTDKNYKTDANGKKIDPNKWKPGMIRGVAGDGSEIGPKHRDIWKAMNSQYFLQEKTFINGK